MSSTGPTTGATGTGAPSGAPRGPATGAPPGPERAPATGLATAAIASLGAGAVHATAVGAHGEHRQAAVAFAVLALLQVVWGAAALVRATRRVAWSGLLLSGGAVAGWVAAKTTGVPFVDGLGTAEGVQFADATAAALAAIAALGSLAWLVDRPRRVRTSRGPALPASAGVASLVLVAMVTTGGHHHGADGHAAGHAHAPGEAAAAHDHGDGSTGADGHRHGSPGAGHAHGGGDDHASDSGDHDHATDPPSDDGTPHDHPADHDGLMPDGHHPGGDTPGGHNPSGHTPGGHDEPGEHGHEPPPGAKPYDATLPVDLGGVPGVTAAQQASAEAVVTDTLINLPQFADTATAYAAGYRSIGDAFTGYEHYVNWSLIDDGRIFDADQPESLVYRVDGGRRTLVSAMYFLASGDTLADVPDMGGPLVQWHVHDDLCFTGAEGAWQVGPLVPPPGTCPPPTVRLDLPPMVHVWIVPHRCGPFAALEGASGGQVGDGEVVRCDHAHGSPA